MKHFKSVCFFLLLIAVVMSTSACSNNEAKELHRSQWWLEAINWETQNRTNDLSGKGVVVAVLDTAIDETHPDLEGNIIEQYTVEGVSEEQRFEHGTAVAGIICASPHNSGGALGVAVDAKILSVDIGGGTEAQVESLIKGIEYAITKKVDIINISAGFIENDPALQAVIDKAYNAGIVIVAASGSSSHGTTLYPARYENVICVGSFDPNGPKMSAESCEAVFLPGGNIVTTHSSTYVPNKYISYTGTSMSAAILTGVISLILEQNPNLTNEDITGYFRNYYNPEFDTVKVLEDFDRIYK